MSIESEILRIQHNIADTYAVVADKGGEVPLQPNSENLAAAVESIPSGGSSGVVNWEDINGRPDLSNVSAIKVVTCVLLSAGWVDGEQNIVIPDISADEKEQLITPVPSNASRNVYYNSNIVCSDQSEGLLTFKSDSIPEEDVTIYVYIQSVAEIGEEYVWNFEWWSPKMTSDNTPSPYVATCSDIYGNTFEAYNAFDGAPMLNTSNNGNQWTTKDNVTDAWIALDVGERIVVKGIKYSPVFPTYNGTETPDNYTLYGSNDGEAWSVIDQRDGLAYDRVFGEYVAFEFKPVSYRYFKLYATSSGTVDKRVAYGDIQFLKLEASQ